MLHHQCEVRVNRWSIHFCHRNHECEASVGGSGASGFGALSASSGNGGGVLQGGIVEIGIDRASCVRAAAHTSSSPASVRSACQRRPRSVIGPSSFLFGKTKSSSCDRPCRRRKLDRLRASLAVAQHRAGALYPVPADPGGNALHLALASYHKCVFC